MPPSAAGKKLTVDKACTACHGDRGKGDGPGAAALNPKPADWTSAKVQQQTDGCLLWKITTGRGAMPPWAALSETERGQLDPVHPDAQEVAPFRFVGAVPDRVSAGLGRRRRSCRVDQLPARTLSRSRLLACELRPR